MDIRIAVVGSDSPNMGMEWSPCAADIPLGVRSRLAGLAAEREG
jgi:hypothetical protein